MVKNICFVGVKKFLHPPICFTALSIPNVLNELTDPSIPYDTHIMLQLLMYVFGNQYVLRIKLGNISALLCIRFIPSFPSLSNQIAPFGIGRVKGCTISKHYWLTLQNMRIHLLAQRNLLMDILRLPSSHRAVLGLYIYMSFSRYDEHGAWTSRHAHCYIGARCATGEYAIIVVLPCEVLVIPCCAFIMFLYLSIVNALLRIELHLVLRNYGL